MVLSQVSKIYVFPALLNEISLAPSSILILLPEPPSLILKLTDRIVGEGEEIWEENRKHQRFKRKRYALEGFFWGFGTSK